jgi:pimeloyl-ACP methyl ester carboxylesterase
MDGSIVVPSHKDWRSRTRQVRLSTGINMHYMEAGDSDAEPLLLIHGFTGSSRDWRQVICELGDRFHIFAVDLRGHGQTDAPDAFIYPMQTHADDLAAFLDAMSIPSAYVLAHSMGTMIGQTLAFTAPSRVKKLFLAAAMMTGHDSAESLRDQLDLYGNINLATAPTAELQKNIPSPSRELPRSRISGRILRDSAGTLGSRAARGVVWRPSNRQPALRSVHLSSRPDHLGH